jgi:hypothetical protein
VKADNFFALYAKLSKRKQVYQLTFGPPGTPGYDMMVDLAKYTHAFDGDLAVSEPNQALIAVGMRRAFFRIFSHVHLDPEQLAQYYRAVQTKGDD